VTTSSLQPDGVEARGMIGELQPGGIRVGIVGLGLVGGSLGMALSSGDAGWRVLGFDAAPGTGEKALARGAIDEVAPSLADLASRTDIIVVAVPTSHVVSVVLEAARHAKPHTVITDCGSVKAPVVEALAALRSDIDFIGGHPMAGAETQGIGAARPDLFNGARWALSQVPGRPAGREALEKIERLIRHTGATPVYVEALEHDRAVAFCSHMPYVLAVSLALACWNARERTPVLESLAARSFRDMTRIARAAPEAPLDYCTLNKDHLVEALDNVIGSLSAVRTALSADESDSLRSMASLARRFLFGMDAQDGMYEERRAWR
jgi:prephenate dehydrogenase